MLGCPIEKLPEYQLAGLPDGEVASIPGCWVARWPDGRVTDLPSCRAHKVVRLGAGSCRFLGCIYCITTLLVGG